MTTKIIEKKIWAVAETITVNGGPIPMSIGGIYKAVKDGNIPHTKIGKRIFIPDWFIKQILSGGK